MEKMTWGLTYFDQFIYTYKLVYDPSQHPELDLKM